MQIMQLIADKQANPNTAKAPTIAFLGDSVTHGCFELNMGENNRIDPVYDKAAAYHADLGRILSVLYPSVQVQIINAGINGDGTNGGRGRLERDVLCYHPDLTVVCFGLNDVHGGEAGIKRYRNNLAEIFGKLKEAGSEVIFMTANMMNTDVSCLLTDEFLRNIAGRTMQLQNEGTFDLYFEAAKEVAAQYGVKVCDVYAKWKQMQKYGVNITNMLSNFINHPTREMHWLFAFSLLETMMQDD